MKKLFLSLALLSMNVFLVKANQISINNLTCSTFTLFLYSNGGNHGYYDVPPFTFALTFTDFNDFITDPNTYGTSSTSATTTEDCVGLRGWDVSPQTHAFTLFANSTFFNSAPSWTIPCSGNTFTAAFNPGTPGGICSVLIN